MKLNRRSRKFHDPWGNKRGNRCGSVIRWQFMVGYEEDNGVEQLTGLVDRVGVMEAVRPRFVLGRKSLEGYKK